MIPAGRGRPVIPTGSIVIVKARGGVRRRGLVVGPEQQFFPRPHSLFVQVGDRTLLIVVTELTVAPEHRGTGADST